MSLNISQPTLTYSLPSKKMEEKTLSLEISFLVHFDMVHVNKRRLWYMPVEQIHAIGNLVVLRNRSS